MPKQRANRVRGKCIHRSAKLERPIQNDATRGARADEALKSASEWLVKDPARALERAKEIVARNPDPSAFRLAARALRALGRREEAAQAELQGVKFGFTQPLKLARSAQQAGRNEEAKSVAEDYLRSNPDDLLAMTILAEADLSLNRADDAESVLRRVVDRAPALSPANLLLAKVLTAQLRLHEAAEILQRLLERVPHDASAKRSLGDLRAQMNDAPGAAVLYEEILASHPNNPADLLRYAHFLRARGLRVESVSALRRAIALSPLSGHPWFALAHYFPEDLTDDDERQIRRAIGERALQSSDRRLFQVAISILEHRRGNHLAAFEAIAAAKAFPPRGPPYDPNALSEHVDELIASYTPDILARFRPQGSRSNSPIFVVGMPRSGSTLVERIVGQHSKVEALGEIPVMPRLIGAEQRDGTAGYRSLLPDSLSGEKVTRLADWYLQRSKEYRHTEKPRFTDKYNGNWIRAGLATLIFPTAKIIDVRRNALDCCWSVFRTDFVDDYANDQRNLARYYADYARFMDAMAAVSPDAILTISYEELVTDALGHTRRILDFLDLDFEAACLDFHLSTAAVATPSSEQVRRPINSEGIGSAEPYRPWLQPLIAELDLALGQRL